MAIDRFFTNAITLKRMSWSNDSSGEISGTGFNGHIQQAGPDLAEYLGESLGRGFIIWCDKDTDVDSGDTLTIATGDYVGEYTVKNVQINATGNNMHLEVICVKSIS